MRHLPPARGKSFLKVGALGSPRKLHLFAKALKCLQEKYAGNREFDEAYDTIGANLRALPLPEVTQFLEDYAPSFLLSVDKMNTL